jgi:hypothetical protein
MTDSPDRSKEVLARNRQREIEHRLRNDMTVTLATFDVVTGDNLEDLLTDLVADAMFHIDLLLTELY